MPCHKYTRGELITLLQLWSTKVGNNLSRRLLNVDTDMPSDMTFRREFGSWGKALIAAGIEIPKPYPSVKCIENTRKAHIGKQSFHWKGGKIENNGYIEVWNPLHPNANKKGYVREHRSVMAEYLKRAILPDEDVHHINGIKNDNRLENLKLITKSEHTRLHHAGIERKRHCKTKCIYPTCDNRTLSKYGLCRKHYKIQWARLKNGKIEYITCIPELR